MTSPAAEPFHDALQQLFPGSVVTESSTDYVITVRARLSTPLSIRTARARLMMIWDQWDWLLTTVEWKWSDSLRAIYVTAIEFTQAREGK